MITVFSKENCIYCKKTNTFLSRLNIDFKEIKLDPSNNQDKEMIEQLKSKYNHYTFPFIIINHNLSDEVFIGGFSELDNSYNTMYLHKLINLIDDNVDF